MPPLDVKTAHADDVFRVFTACRDDPVTLILDVRPNKQFAKKHVMQAFSIRLTADGNTLLDYSKSSYKMPWSNHCWWDKHVIVYGEAGLKKDHPVVAYLAREAHARSLSICKEGFDAIEKAYPFICTASVKANSAKKYPSQIVPGLLYLGEWPGVDAFERLQELGVRRVITIHNNPERLKVPPQFKALRFQVADVDTEDISACLAPTYDFIEQAAAQSHGVLVHCGAGVSRSATLVIAYLMRKQRLSASKARDLVVKRRSVVEPNDGFWRTLCALEVQLGIQDRSNPEATTGGRGADAGDGDARPAVKLAENAAGEKVSVRFVEVSTSTSGAAGAVPAAGTSGTANGQADGAGGERDGRCQAKAVERDSKRRRSRSRSRDQRDGDRQRSRSRSRDRRDRDRRRSRSRSRDRRDRDRRRSRSRSRDRNLRDRERRRSRSRQGDRSGRSKWDILDGSGVSAADASGPAAAAAAAPPRELEPEVVLEVLREGKAIGAYHLGRVGPTQTVVFGRLPSCDITLEHLSISRQHAQLQVDRAGVLTLTDMGSAHGTNVDDIWIRANVPRQLSLGSVFKFGGSTRLFRVAKMQSAKAGR